MGFINLNIHKEHKTATVVINRPESLNALNSATIKELSTAFDQLEQDTECRVIIITGSGEKSFVAGADIKEFSDFNTENAENLARNGQNILFNKIESDGNFVVPDNFNEPPPLVKTEKYIFGFIPCLTYEFKIK